MWELANLRSLVIECLHKGSLVVLIAFCLATPVRIAAGSVQCVVIAVAALSFLAVDLYKSTRPAMMRNVVVAMTYLLILVGFIAYYGSAAPRFQEEVFAWSQEHGFRLAATCLGAAVMEEVLFRRYAQFHLRRFLPMGWALLVNALIFMLMHGGVVVDIFLAGIAFGILVSYFQCIYAAMFVHALSNFVSLAGYTMPRSDEVMSASLVLMGSSASSFVFASALLMGSLAIRYVRSRRA